VAVRSENIHFTKKPGRKVFTRNPYTLTNIDEVWEMDLADLSSLSKYENYNFLLNIRDIFSRYAWSVLLKENSISSITSVLKYFFQDRKPIIIQSDKVLNLLMQQRL